MSTQRIRVRDPLTGKDLILDKPLGPQVYRRGSYGAATSAPASTIGNMQPVMTGALPNLRHLTRGRSASRAFRIK